MDKKDYFRDTDEGWIMQQILLDNLALGEGIPLRIIRLEELRGLYQHFCNAQDEKNNDKQNNDKDDENDRFNFTESFPDKSTFDTFSKQVVDWFLNAESTDKDNEKISYKLKGLKKLYRYFSNNIFPVLPSNLHSLEFLSQTIVKYWRIYSVLWLYQKLGCDDAAVLNGNKSTCLEKVYGFNNCWARYQMVKIRDEDDSDRNVLLLAGPVFEVDVTVLTNETDVDTEVTDKAEGLLARLIKRTADSNHDSGSYFRQAIQLETIRQENFLRKRFDNVLRIWGLLYDASIVDDTKISHKYLRMLTVWAQHVDAISKEKADEDLHINNVFLSSDGLYGEKRRNVQLSAVKKEGAWHIGMKALDANTAVESASKEHEAQQDKFYDLYTRLERKTKQLDKNRLIVMDLWLESQFSAPLNSSDKESPDEDHVGYRLAAWICAALRADVAMIHACHPETDKSPVEIQEIFIRDKKYQWLRKGTIEGMKNLSKEKQDRSNIYGVLLKGRERICLDRELASRSKNEDDKKPHEALCKIEISLKDMHTEWPRENAAMMVPIKFNGRVLGAIEVISIGRWRFRWGQSMLLLNIATNLGAYWYQHRHLGCLNKIQTKVLDFNQQKCDQKNLYDEICKQAAVLFLCQGAGLWLSDGIGIGGINPDLFVRVGEHGVAIVDKEQSVKEGGTFISDTVKEAENDNTIAIRCKSVAKGDGISEENRKKLAELGIEYVAHIPIRDKDGKVIAILSLYDNSGREFDQSWHFIAQFFAGHLHVLIDSVAAVIRDGEGIMNLVLHQIWDSGSHLANKAGKIVARISGPVDDLDQIYSVLSDPRIISRLETANIMGEIPKNIDIYNDLRNVISRLKAHSSQPYADMIEQATRLRDQVYVFSAGFNNGRELLIPHDISKHFMRRILFLWH